MKNRNKIIWVCSFLLFRALLFSQNERLIIGRTTGKLELDNTVIQAFGFADSLSGQITFPGSYIDIKEGDSILIDFWNISQGNPVSLYCKEIEFVQHDKENEVMKVKEAVHHMEHGFYSFQAKKSGTYLYYSPENYPFNLQAGMFGVIVIRPKENEYSSVKPSKEVMWCSNELDSQWHTDTIMGTEYDPSNKAVILPKYKPDYFLINGETFSKNKGLQSLAHKKDTLLLRLVNAGLYEHEIVFPSRTKLHLLYGKDFNIKAVSKGYQLKLHPGECFELLAYLGDTGETEKIKYRFINPALKKTSYKAAIPVFY
ncbi:multicopper oxidase domain-containing protein [Flavobacterium sp. HJJ]|uniref:multicopper oxidase domain-containing protein n=1 Tax=Flavobacterium sp. HJJ TaxID=2783792 RepID=UPI00188A8AA2|nr:multicopper oxidase domain-containing protein [Flavobacterium sp. HJJ]MBF4469829.1 multicopper oxidase domain-containing protein [Flavobacterium sp. HJJ]